MKERLYPEEIWDANNLDLEYYKEFQETLYVHPDWCICKDCLDSRFKDYLDY